jgi:hypothetical protein
VRPRPLRGLAAALALGLALAGTDLLACGLEDPSSVASLRGALALAYPQSPQVGTAVWQAQLAGKLPRDPVAQQGELSADARAVIRRVRANTFLRQLAVQLSAPGAASSAPSLAVVLLGPVMWNRFAPQDGKVMPLLHVEGPEPGDVVVVTELPVVEAIATGSLGFAAALEAGVLRLYGEPQVVARARAWLAARG